MQYAVNLISEVKLSPNIESSNQSVNYSEYCEQNMLNKI